MTEPIERHEEAEILRPLPVLAPLIKEELEAGDKAGLEHYIKAGEMLLEAKAQVRYGTWTAWIEKNFHLSKTTAERYMRLAESSETARAPFSTLSSATQPNREPSHRPAWHEPVKRLVGRVNVEALEAGERSRDNERKLMRTLSHQLIDIGFKILAAKLHPDRGGSAAAMARLNKVRKLLKEAI